LIKQLHRSILDAITHKTDAVLDLIVSLLIQFCQHICKNRHEGFLDVVTQLLTCILHKDTINGHYVMYSLFYFLDVHVELVHVLEFNFIIVHFLHHVVCVLLDEENDH
jgi:hypothetical protein